MHNPDFSIKMEKGRPVVNPLHDPESCHEGDNVCQKGTDRSRVPGPYGFTITDLRATFTDGRPVPFPLEDDNSRDCIMQMVRDFPCAVLAADRSNLLTRPRVFYAPGALRPLRDRTPAEFEKLWRNPESLGRGDNHTQVVDNYEELCIDPNLPLCNADIPIACYCPNHQECAPRADLCGNKAVDRGATPPERCDESATPNGCPSGQACMGCARCVSGCGNGTIDRNARPPERCDHTATPSGCGPNERCNACRECVPVDTHSECRGQKCVSVPGAGSSQCSSDSDCAPPPPPPPAPDLPCPPEVLGRYQGRANVVKTGTTLTTVRRTARDELGANPHTVTVGITVSGGFASPSSITVDGHPLPSSLVNLGGIPAGVDSCIGTITVPIPPG
jgi:hypothetical protein